jgi:hypothetical protein
MLIESARTWTDTSSSSAFTASIVQHGVSPATVPSRMPAIAASIVFA